MTQCENSRELKFYMRIPYQNSITRCVIVEDDAKRKLQGVKNQYKQVHIGDLFQAK